MIILCQEKATNTKIFIFPDTVVSAGGDESVSQVFFFLCIGCCVENFVYYITRINDKHTMCVCNLGLYDARIKYDCIEPGRRDSIRWVYSIKLAWLNVWKPICVMKRIIHRYCYVSCYSVKCIAPDYVVYRPYAYSNPKQFRIGWTLLLLVHSNLHERRVCIAVMCVWFMLWRYAM